jgi:beta-glucosidase
LIHSVAQLNPNTIVILEGSGPFFMRSWVSDVSAVLTAWYPGMRGGQAVAEILFGLVNPSGKLPLTFPASDDQLPPFDNRSREVTFDAYHGYRFVDRAGVVPQFPFGHGLSYTTFEYSDLQIAPATIATNDRTEISVEVSNTGNRAGDEIVQLYVSYQGSAVERPVNELESFGRLSLEPGESKRILFDVDAKQLGYFDVEANAWKVEPVEVTIAVGASSRDLRLEGSLGIR